MKILVACEESQAVTSELRKLGHEAYSCDLVPCSGGHPEWHLQQDVTPLLSLKWDMIIAFPPCTYLTKAGAVRLFPAGQINVDRYNLGLAAKDFFMSFYNADCPKIAIENPTPMSIFNLPPCNQIIQPYMFGEPYSKRTCLWLRGLPILLATDVLSDFESTSTAAWFNNGGRDRQRRRSKTFPGVAKAMAFQWAGPVNEV